MTRIELAPAVADDLERILNHLAEHEVADRRVRTGEIIHALSVLESNPSIGRPARNDMRELIIGRESRGYVALYRYISAIDAVFVLAIGSQREAGYNMPWRG